MTGDRSKTTDPKRKMADAMKLGSIAAYALRGGRARYVTERPITNKHPKTTVVQLRRSYEAKLQVCRADGIEFHIAGTLDGYIDVAIIPSEGRSLTYSLSSDGARQIIAALHGAIDDIQANCLFDRDPLLVDDRTREQGR